MRSKPYKKHRRNSKMDNKSITYSRWNCTYHLVFIPKYRRKIMYGELKKDIREILRSYVR